MSNLADARGIDAALLDWIGQQLTPLWWHQVAACRDAGSEIFFIERGQTSAAAKRICAVCPVVNACLEWALSQSETPEGIWGGMSRMERRAERKRRRLATQAA